MVSRVVLRDVCRVILTLCLCISYSMVCRVMLCGVCVVLVCPLCVTLLGTGCVTEGFSWVDVGRVVVLICVLLVLKCVVYFLM